MSSSFSLFFTFHQIFLQLESCFTYFFIVVILILNNTQAFAAENLYLVFDKALYRLEIREKEKTLQSFEAGYGLKSSLFKTKKGDFLTPEGIYEIKSIRPSQRYFYFVELSYPNENDISWAYFKGELEAESSLKVNHLGNDIGIHGGGPTKIVKGKRNLNWTQGCIALSNEDLKIILPLLKPGQKVFIINSSKSLYEILKKLAYPVRVNPLDFWEGELYLKLNDETYWYFRVLEKETGLKILTFKEWIKGRLNKHIISHPDGSIESEKKLKETFFKKLHLIVEPKTLNSGYLWR